MTVQVKHINPKTGMDSIKSMFLSGVLLGGLWWVITSGSVASWLIGLPALASAAWASRQLGGLSDIRISLSGLARFLPFFLWQSLRGGADVALRTLAPRLRIHPGFSRYRTGLKTPSARTFFTNCVSLLPGTLAADMQDEWVEVHVLNIKSNFNSELTRLEHVVAQLFAEGGDAR